MTTAQEIKRIREHRHRRANQKTAAPQDTSSTSNEEMVWITATGSKYHNKNNCGTTDPSKASEISRAEAESRGYAPCKKCFR